MSIEVDADTNEFRFIINPQRGVPSGPLTFWLTVNEANELAEKIREGVMRTAPARRVAMEQGDGTP